MLCLHMQPLTATRHCLFSLRAGDFQWHERRRPLVIRCGCVQWRYKVEKGLSLGKYGETRRSDCQLKWRRTGSVAKSSFVSYDMMGIYTSKTPDLPHFSNKKADLLEVEGYMHYTLISIITMASGSRKAKWLETCCKITEYLSID